MLHTSLVRFHLRRSTACERGREKRQNDGALADEVRKVDRPAIRRRKREIRSFVPHL